ncbi:hypothetical protein ES705_18391 [subsurface metagenome]
MENKKDEQPKPPSTDLEALLKELPEKYQPVIRHLVVNVLNGLVKTNDRLAELEKRPAIQEAPGAFDGLTPEQKYNILMSKAQAPAAQAQMALYQGLLTSMKGGNSAGGFDSLLASAEKIQSLRAILAPEPSPMQHAMERATIGQMIAQTRLMNKVAGKETSAYLDKMEKEISE